MATRHPDRFAAFVIGNTWAWPNSNLATQMFSRVLGGRIGGWLILQRNFFVECATDASWFLLRLLTSREHFRGELVSNELRDFAGERDIERRIWELWGLREPPEGN